MSKISIEEVMHVAHLARLNISESEAKLLTAQMNDILKYMEKLNELNTDGVVPTSHPLQMSTAWREDEVKPNADFENALANSPEREGNFIVVPRVIE
jgi:aspartyl-tRNA(Asn)/glutamyl-tRNA(Gln) amidotransferase subunit C